MGCDQRWFDVFDALLELLVETLTELRHHGGAARHNYLAIEDTSEVNVTILNAGGDHIVHSRVLKSDQLWLE